MMKILKTLFVALLLSCPLFGQAQAPNYPYTTLIVPKVQIVGNCTGKVVAADGTGCVSGGSGSGTVSSGIAGQYAGYGATGTTVVGVIPFGPTVTDPPYNCTCNGIADDTTCIQAAADANGSIQLPHTVGGFASTRTCAVTHIIQHNETLDIFFNGSNLNGTASSGAMISTSLTTADDEAQLALRGGGYVSLTSPTGTPSEIDVNGYSAVLIENVWDGPPGPSGYASISSSGVAGALITIIGSTLGGSVSFGSSSDVDLSMVSTVLSGPFSMQGVDNIQAVIGTNDPGGITGAAQVGYLCYNDHAGTIVCHYYGVQSPGLIYSHAGTQLAACSASQIGTAWVSDATSLTAGTAYDPTTGAGSITAPVRCTHSGSTFAWSVY